MAGPRCSRYTAAVERQDGLAGIAGVGGIEGTGAGDDVADQEEDAEGAQEGVADVHSGASCDSDATGSEDSVGSWGDGSDESFIDDGDVCEGGARVEGAEWADVISGLGSWGGLGEKDAAELDRLERLSKNVPVSRAVAGGEGVADGNVRAADAGGGDAALGRWSRDFDLLVTCCSALRQRAAMLARRGFCSLGG